MGLLKTISSLPPGVLLFTAFLFALGGVIAWLYHDFVKDSFRKASESDAIMKCKCDICN